MHHHHSTITATPNSTNTPPATTNNTTILSPRYSEFKMYNSTFDGLQALENSNNHINCSGGSGSDINGSANNLSTSSSNGSNVPLMRVASLPSMSPAHSGKYLITIFYADTRHYYNQYSKIK